jgi:hypothetical protein
MWLAWERQDLAEQITAFFKCWRLSFGGGVGLGLCDIKQKDQRVENVGRLNHDAYK